MCELCDITRLGPLSMSKYFSVTRFEFFQINWVMFSRQMVFDLVNRGPSKSKTNEDKVPSATSAKIITKILFTKKMFWGNQCCTNKKRITLQSKFLGLLSCKKRHASGSNTTKKIIWWKCFVVVAKFITNENVPRNCFAIISVSSKRGFRKRRRQ